MCKNEGRGREEGEGGRVRGEGRKHNTLHCDTFCRKSSMRKVVNNLLQEL